MGNNNSAHRGVQRHAAQHAAQINEGLDSLTQDLRQLIRERNSSTGPADIPSASRTLLICAAIKIIRQRFIVVMRRQDIDPRFRFVSAMIAVALGCMECGLLMCVLLGDLPWPIFVACFLMLVVPFVLIAS